MVGRVFPSRGLLAIRVFLRESDKLNFEIKGILIKTANRNPRHDFSSDDRLVYLSQARITQLTLLIHPCVDWFEEAKRKA